jgi:hypothetical protein
MSDSNDIKQALRDVLFESACYSRMLDTLSSKGPCYPDSERVLLGALLAGEAVEGSLLPCRAVDFTVPMHRACFIACCVVEPGEANKRLAKIVLAMEADGVCGVSVDELLKLREWCHGERLEPHIRLVAEAGAGRRMARYLEGLAQDIRLGLVTASQAEERLAKKLKEPECRSEKNVVPLAGKPIRRSSTR